MEKFKYNSQVISIRNLSPSLYFLSFERKDIGFIPGQHVSLSIKGEDKSRLFSIASGKDELTFKVLIREISNGDLSVRLRQLNQGSDLVISQPVGYFTLAETNLPSPIICICTGSGIAPFLSFASSYLERRFIIIHGVSSEVDKLTTEFSNNVDYISCVTKDRSGDFYGRVTQYVKQMNLDYTALYYLCGNGEMIHEVYTYLRKANIPRDQIYYEEYFNN